MVTVEVLNHHAATKQRAEQSMLYFDMFPKKLRDKINEAPVALNVEYLYLEIFHWEMHKRKGMSAEKYIDHVIRQNQTKEAY